MRMVTPKVHEFSGGCAGASMAGFVLWLWVVVTAATGQEEPEHLQSCSAPGWPGGEYGSERDHCDQEGVDERTLAQEAEGPDDAGKERRFAGHQAIGHGAAAVR